MKVGFGRSGFVGEDICAAGCVGGGMVDEERDLVRGVLMLLPLRDA